MCWARLTTRWVWSFNCSILYEKGNKTVPINMQVWCWWELIHLMSILRLRYSGIIDIIVFVYNCIKVFNRLASERYFLTLEIQLIWISTCQTELSLISSRWRSSRRIAPQTNPASLFKNQQFSWFGYQHLRRNSHSALSLGSSHWRSSRQIAPRTNPASLFKNQQAACSPIFKTLFRQEIKLLLLTWPIAWLGHFKWALSMSSMLTDCEVCGTEMKAALSISSGFLLPWFLPVPPKHSSQCLATKQGTKDTDSQNRGCILLV
jgi:hypothetical protein